MTFDFAPRIGTALTFETPPFSHKQRRVNSGSGTGRSRTESGSPATTCSAPPEGPISTPSSLPHTGLHTRERAKHQPLKSSSWWQRRSCSRCCCRHLPVLKPFHWRSLLESEAFVALSLVALSIRWDSPLRFLNSNLCARLTRLRNKLGPTCSLPMAKVQAKPPSWRIRSAITTARHRPFAH